MYITLKQLNIQLFTFYVQATMIPSFFHTEPVRISLTLEISSTHSMGYHYIYPINDDIISGYDE